MYIPDEGIKFELRPSPKKDKNGQPVLYAIPDTSLKCSLDQYAKDAEQRGLIHAVHLKTALGAFLEEAGLLLSRGYRVMTPFGSFALKLKMKEDFTDPDKVKGTDVEVDGIEFTPNKAFLERAKDNVHTPRKKKQKQGLEVVNDLEARDALLNRILNNWGYVSVPLLINNSNMKSDMARDYLNSLCEGEQPLLWCDKQMRPYQYKLRPQK